MIPAELLRRKRDGGELHATDIQWFVHGVCDGTVSEAQAAAFLMASCIRGLSAAETGALTLAMAKSGRRFSFGDTGIPRIDKHSTGGVGDKLSLLLVPLLAASGVAVPMMSGRGLGHTGGTVDKLESVLGLQMAFDDATLHHLLSENKCFMIKQTDDVAPADGILYALRDVTGTVESTGLITASILSKKLCEDLHGLVLDMKVGNGAFMPTLDAARTLAESMIDVARSVGLPLRILFTRMDEPIGRMVGNWLEMVETEQCLADMHSTPADILELTMALASRMLMLAFPILPQPQAEENLRKVWADGTAHAAFHTMIKAQHGNWQRSVETYAHPLVIECRAEASGVFVDMKTRELGVAGIELGAGRKLKTDSIDPMAGFVIEKKIGDRVEKGDILCRIHTSNRNVPEQLIDTVRSCFVVGGELRERMPLIIDEWVA
ncbi:MAG: thymidine phosphorylase [Candidatus Kapabacteria bacterium]|nr:thymidine phosphorylase [Candidatus Kapabacteria bacterium]